MFLTRGITQDEAKHYMNTAKDKATYRRWQTVWLLASGTDIKKIPAIVQVSLVTTYKIIHRFNDGGPEAMETKKRGGRTWGKTTLEQEEAVLKELVADSTKGLIVTAKTIKKKMEQTLQEPVSLCYAYDMLKRHEWRKVVPRPTHPKTDKEKQEEFKKKFQISSKKRSSRSKKATLAL
jgi:transposase